MALLEAVEREEGGRNICSAFVQHCHKYHVQHAYVYMKKRAIYEIRIGWH